MPDTGVGVEIERELSPVFVTTAVYDSLTQHYELLRTIELGKRRDRDQPPLEQRTQTDSIEQMRDWMTEFDQLPDLELPETARDAPLPGDEGI